jgi:hypothetical protein
VGSVNNFPEGYIKLESVYSEKELLDFDKNPSEDSREKVLAKRRVFKYLWESFATIKQ